MSEPILCHECGHDIRCENPPSDIAHALPTAEPTEAEVEAAAAAIYAELSGHYGDFNWPSGAARAALRATRGLS